VVTPKDAGRDAGRARRPSRDSTVRVPLEDTTRRPPE